MNHLLPRLAEGGRLYRPDAAGHPDPALAALAVQRGAGAAVRGLAKDIVYRMRIRLIERLKRISLGNTKAWAAAR
jgi:hypothetical protein